MNLRIYSLTNLLTYSLDFLLYLLDHVNNYGDLFNTVHQHLVIYCVLHNANYLLITCANTYMYKICSQDL